jgi:hypothetical protein
MKAQQFLKIACLLCVAMLPAVVQAQFNFTTNSNNTITITSYTGNGSAVTIPDTINGLPVTSIGDRAFNNFFGNFFVQSVTIPNSVTNIGVQAFRECSHLTNVTIGNSVVNIGYNAFDQCTSLTSMTIPDSVTNIGEGAFCECYHLTNVTIGNSVTSIGDTMFSGCTRLTSMTIPNSVTSIGDSVFSGCTSLTSMTIPNSVTSIGKGVFVQCTRLTSVTIGTNVTSLGMAVFYQCGCLTGVYFQGNAPSIGPNSFYGDNTTIYYLPWTKGWDSLTGYIIVPWLPQVQISDGSFGVRTNQFGFNIDWASSQTVVVETCTNLANPDWLPVGTNILTGGSSYFSDPQWMNYPGRFYRLRSL